MTNMSPAAEKAIRRIRVLQVLADRTGFKTHEEQFKILMSLEDADCLAVAEVLHKARKGVANGNPR